MDKTIGKILNKKKISDKTRHVRWNYEKSDFNEGFVRYHFVVVDDRDRKGILKRILGQLQEVQGGLIPIRENVEGRVAGTGLKYLISTYDSRTAPDFISWDKIKKPIKFDEDLRERTGKRNFRNLEDYVAELYNK